MLDNEYIDEVDEWADRNSAFRELLDPAAYKGYLQTMVHFHRYSIRNILLIYKQMPHATRLAAYGAWPKQKRNVKKGGKSIKILSPKPIKSTGVQLTPKINPDTGSSLLDLDVDGKKVSEELTYTNVEFEETTVFDVSQTYGKHIQKLNDNPTADEALRGAFLDALKAVISLPVTHDVADVADAADASHDVTQDKIPALINEIVNAKLPTFPQLGERLVRDSIIFVLYRKFGLDVGDFPFGFLDFTTELQSELLPKLADYLDAIKTEVGSLITAIEGKFVQICRDKGLNPMIDFEPNAEPAKTQQNAEPPKQPPKLIQEPSEPTIQPALTSVQKTTLAQKEIPQQPLYSVIERIEKTALGVDFTHYDIIPVMPVFEAPTSAENDGQQIQPLTSHIQTPQSTTQQISTQQAPSHQKPPPEVPLRQAPKHNGKHIPPDPLITITDRDKYGYNRRGELLPLTKERAINLYRRNMSIYALYPDNREAMIFHHSEIETHNGIFAVPHSEWHGSKEYLAIASGNPEAQKEAAFLYDNKNAFAVYQLKEAHDSGDNETNINAEQYQYTPYELLTEMGLFVSKENYRLTYTGQLLPSDNPERIFMRFNMEKPEGYKGKSMGISDVLSIQEDSVIASHYVDKGRYTELISFTGEEGRSARHRMEEETNEQTTTPEEPEKSGQTTQPAATTEPAISATQSETTAELQQASQSTLSTGNENKAATTNTRQSETTPPSTAEVTNTGNTGQSDNPQKDNTKPNESTALSDNTKSNDKSALTDNATSNDNATTKDNATLNNLPSHDTEMTAFDKLSEAMQDLTDLEVYPLSLAEAKKDGKENVYELNLAINYGCAKDIDKHIRACKVKNSEGEYRILDAVKKVILHYGRKRVAWVLAMAVKNAESNTFSKDNENWAIQLLKVVGYPKEPAVFSFKTAPVLLEVFISRFREIESDPKPFYEERLKSAEKRMKLQANNKPQ